VTDTFIALLMQHGALEWARSVGGERHDGAPLAPLVVWRFESAQPHLEDEIRVAVASRDIAAAQASSPSR
jgi:hypothetical protein